MRLSPQDLVAKVKENMEKAFFWSLLILFCYLAFHLITTSRSMGRGEMEEERILLDQKRAEEARKEERRERMEEERIL